MTINQATKVLNREQIETKNLTRPDILKIAKRIEIDGKNLK